MCHRKEEVKPEVPPGRQGEAWGCSASSSTLQSAFPSCPQQHLSVLRPLSQPHKKGRKTERKEEKRDPGAAFQRGLRALAAEPGGDRCCCSVCPKTKEQKITLGFPVCLWRDQTRGNFLVWLPSGKSLGLRGCSPSLPGGHLPGQPGTASGHPQDRWQELGTAFCRHFLSPPFPGGETEAGRDLTQKSRAVAGEGTREGEAGSGHGCGELLNGGFTSPCWELRMGLRLL